MTKLILQSIRQTILWTIVTGGLYPLFITAIAQLAFHNQANGSLLEQNGKTVGSALIAQPFTGTNYFWPRPSAAGYATVPSGASNLGPTSGQLKTNVMNYAVAFRAGNNLPVDAPVPADMVFTSGSGVDPDISPEAAQLQIARVAAARGLSLDKVKALVKQFTEPPQWGFLGEPRVNVLELNLVLEKL